MENSLENSSYDWSHLQQLGKPLDGESVVQRTLYLLKSQEQKELIHAYDQARFEFYRIRMQQEVEEQLAEEEAEMFGSIFHSTAVQYGIAKEQKVLESWKRKATQQAELMAARKSNPSASWAAENETEKPEQTEVEELQL